MATSGVSGEMPKLKDSMGLVAVAGTDRESCKADLIFIHGFIGGSQTTWAAGEKPENFWSAWLAEEFSNLGIWTLGYHTTVSAWVERALPGCRNQRVGRAGTARPTR